MIVTVQTAEIHTEPFAGWVARTVDGSVYAFASTLDAALGQVARLAEDARARADLVRWPAACCARGLIASETEFRLTRGRPRTLALLEK